MSTLSSESCNASRPGDAALHGKELQALQAQLDGAWRVVEEHHLEREYAFPDFASALAFTNAVGAVAEAENHHPDIFLAWGKVRITIWTHTLGGISRSDFILAAKIDTLEPAVGA
jgi:4a-hydroxytetrahydrobiopterin dehydratase